YMSNQYRDKSAESNNFTLAKTQEDIAQELGITKQQLHNYKKHLTLISELQDMVEEKDTLVVVISVLCQFKCHIN
ncbi:hypothetical protein P4H61_15445, partial [Paenibacillus peoriae]|uniref:hypothetical protein n=2 Tax=Paenibacillus peoriae TaxID=59893 RepID=UPI002DBDBC04